MDKTSPSNCKRDHSHIKDKICMWCYKTGLWYVLINNNEDCHKDASITLSTFKQNSVHCLLFVIKTCWNSHKLGSFLMWLDSLVQNAAFKSILVQTISQESICKILFILLPCLHTTKQLRNSPIPVLAESSPDSVNNCEKRYWQQPCKFTLFYRNRQPATPCTQRLILF